MTHFSQKKCKSLIKKKSVLRWQS